MNPKMKVKKASNKNQGEKAIPKQSNSGMGLEFAQSLGNILEGAKSKKGSDEQAFLGVKKETLDPEQHTKNMLYKGRKK